VSARAETRRSGFAGPVGRSDQIPVVRHQLQATTPNDSSRVRRTVAADPEPTFRV